MAVAVWPETLPQSMLLDDYSEGMGESRRFSKTDTGPGKVFRKTSAIARPMPGSMVMTGDQLAIFETFFHDEIKEGSLPFTFPNQRGGDDLLVRFAFDSQPSWSSPGPDIWRVGLPLEILP